MAKLLVLLIVGVLPGILSQCVKERALPYFQRYAYEFAVELTNRIAQEKENHFVASTLSPWTLLSCASLGAAGNTLEQLTTVLGLHKQQCFNDFSLETVKNMTTDTQSVKLERSSTIFVDDAFVINDKFQQRVVKTGVSSIKYLSFSDPETLAAIINDYVSRATHDTISDIVVPSDLENIYLLMIDAIYFKGSWQKPFPHEQTAPEPFFNDRGAQVGEVNMMSQFGRFNLTWINLIKAKVLELPYSADGRYSMLIFLPYQDVPLSYVIDSLKRMSLTTVSVLFKQDGEQTVLVRLPRFKITSDLNNLKELLTDMGIRNAFDSELAEFPNITNYPLYIANFIQKANIEVTEEGTEASAATEAGFGTRSGPEEFIASKPFLYMIVDKKTEVPIFTGAYSKPSLY